MLRADFGPIIVRCGANIQDGSVLHGGDDPVTEVGEGAPPGMTVPAGMLAVGTPARIAREVSGAAKEWVDTNPQVYRELARRHAAGITAVSSSRAAG